MKPSNYQKGNNQENFYLSQQELKLKPNTLASMLGHKPIYDSQLNSFEDKRSLNEKGAEYSTA